MEYSQLVAAAGLFTAAVITAGHYGFQPRGRQLSRLGAYTFGTATIFGVAAGAMALLGYWWAMLIMAVCVGAAGATTFILYWIDAREAAFRKAQEEARLVTRRHEIAAEYHEVDLGRGGE